MASTAVSIGYERRSIHDLVSELVERGVSLLLDVRAVAFSHRVEYRKRALERALAAAGIEYVHMPGAGNPYRNERADIERCLASYRKHLDANPDVSDAIAATIAETGAVAILCYERAHQLCHRSILLENVGRVMESLAIDVVE